MLIFFYFAKPKVWYNGQELGVKLRGGSGRQGGRLVSNSQLPNFLPSNFDVKMRRAASDKPTDFVAGDERAETQASLTSIQVLDKFLTNLNIPRPTFRTFSSMSTTGLPVISFQHWRWSPCCLNISHLALCRESWTRLLWTRGFTRWVPPCLRHHVREACSSQNQPKQLQILRHHVSTWKSAGDEKAGGSRDATHHLHRVSPRCPGSFFSVKHVFVPEVSE